MKEAWKFGVVLWFILVLFLIFTFARVSRTASRIGNPSQTSGDTKKIFDDKCAKCHGKDGRAKTFRGKLTHARDLTDAQWQAEVTDERLFNSISNGRNKMPDFKKNLSESQIDALVKYVRQLKK